MSFTVRTLGEKISTIGQVQELTSWLRAQVCLGIRSTTLAEPGQAKVNAKENKWKDSKPHLQSIHACLMLHLAKFH